MGEEIIDIVKSTQESITKIDLKKAAEELLNWLIDNVEQYIDNKETIFSLYFPVDKEKMAKMDNLFALGSLYLLLNDDNIKKGKDLKCMKFLDESVAKIKQIASEESELKTKLFRKLIYYYEMIGFNVKTGPVIQDMDGYVKIVTFLFEPIGLDIVVTKKYNKKLPDGSLVDSDKASEVVKKEHIPEGFVLEMELKKWPKHGITSVF